MYFDEMMESSFLPDALSPDLYEFCKNETEETLIERLSMNQPFLIDFFVAACKGGNVLEKDKPELFSRLVKKIEDLEPMLSVDEIEKTMRAAYQVFATVSPANQKELVRLLKGCVTPENFSTILRIAQELKSFALFMVLQEFLEKRVGFKIFLPEPTNWAELMVDIQSPLSVRYEELHTRYLAPLQNSFSEFHLSVTAKFPGNSKTTMPKEDLIALIDAFGNAVDQLQLFGDEADFSEEQLQGMINKIPKLIFLAFDSLKNVKKIDLSKIEIKALQIADCSFENIQVDEKIEKLNIQSCPVIKTVNLPGSLKKIIFGDCPELSGFADWPPALRKLILENLPQVKIPPLPPTVEELELEGIAVEDETMFHQLPERLEKLRIAGCRGLKQLRNLPLGLDSLFLEDCPDLHEIESFPNTLRLLEVLRAPLLKQLPSLPNLLFLKLKNVPLDISALLPQLFQNGFDNGWLLVQPWIGNFPRKEVGEFLAKYPVLMLKRFLPAISRTIFPEGMLPILRLLLQESSGAMREFAPFFPIEKLSSEEVGEFPPLIREFHAIGQRYRTNKPQLTTQQEEEIEWKDIPERSIDQLLELFDRINFDNPLAPGYWDPEKLTIEKNRVTKAQCREVLETLVKQVKARAAYSLVPTEPEAKEKWYRNFENILKHVIEQLQNQEESDPLMLGGELLRLVEVAVVCGPGRLRGVKKAALYLLGKWELTLQEESPEKLISSLLDSYLIGIVTELAIQVSKEMGSESMQPHIFNWIAAYMADVEKIHLPAAAGADLEEKGTEEMLKEYQIPEKIDEAVRPLALTLYLQQEIQMLRMKEGAGHFHLILDGLKGWAEKNLEMLDPLLHQKVLGIDEEMPLRQYSFGISRLKGILSDLSFLNKQGVVPPTNAKDRMEWSRLIQPIREEAVQMVDERIPDMEIDQEIKGVKRKREEVEAYEERKRREVEKETRNLIQKRLDKQREYEQWQKDPQSYQEKIRELGRDAAASERRSLIEDDLLLLLQREGKIVLHGESLPEITLEGVARLLEHFNDLTKAPS